MLPRAPPRFCHILMTHPHWQSIFNTLPFILCFRRLIPPSVRSANHAILPQKRYFPPPLSRDKYLLVPYYHGERVVLWAVPSPSSMFPTEIVCIFFVNIVTRLAEMCLVFLGRYSSDSQAIKDAIATVEQISCVRFKTKTNEQYYIKFVRGNG